MIQYGKTLTGGGTKLTAVHDDSIFISYANITSTHPQVLIR